MASPFRNYLIFYRFDELTIEILAVIHGARNLKNLLPKLESGESG
jgi:plasmid stabilization system protein ParE